MITGKTKSGFPFAISRNKIDSYKFLRMIDDADQNPTRIVRLIFYLLGDQENALLEHLGGDPSIEQMNEAVTDIFAAIREDKTGKNF